MNEKCILRHRCSAHPSVCQSRGSAPMAPQDSAPAALLHLWLHPFLLFHDGQEREGSLEPPGRGQGEGPLPPARRGKVRKRSRFWATCFHSFLKVLKSEDRVGTREPARVSEGEGLGGVGPVPEEGAQKPSEERQGHQPRRRAGGPSRGDGGPVGSGSWKREHPRPAGR